MDSSIWDPPENQDESSYQTNSWQYNLYFDPRLDVIEEDALNEKSCLQVLKILINKADSEIVELDDDILMLQKQLACEDHMCFAAFNKKIANLDRMLRALKNENEQHAEPGVGSSNLPECLNKMEAIDNHKSKDIGCIAQVNDTVLASPVQPAETTLVERNASEQETKEYSSKSTQEGVKAIQSNDPSGMKGQEVVHTETDCTIEETRPRLLNSKTNERSNPRKKLKRGCDDYGDKTIKETQQQLAGAKRAGDFADISATSSETSFCEPVLQGNNDQRDIQNMLVKSHGGTSQEPRIISSAHNVEVVSHMSSITPAPCIVYIDKMALVQLKALANQHNIYGVSKTRKVDLQQLLRSKLPPKYWS